jgi:hypothetical protein
MALRTVKVDELSERLKSEVPLTLDEIRLFASLTGHFPGAVSRVEADLAQHQANLLQDLISAIDRFNASSTQFNESNAKLSLRMLRLTLVVGALAAIQAFGAIWTVLHH